MTFDLASVRAQAAVAVLISGRLRLTIKDYPGSGKTFKLYAASAPSSLSGGSNPANMVGTPATKVGPSAVNSPFWIDLNADLLSAILDPSCQLLYIDNAGTANYLECYGYDNASYAPLLELTWQNNAPSDPTYVNVSKTLVQPGETITVDCGGASDDVGVTAYNAMWSNNGGASWNVIGPVGTSFNFTMPSTPGTTIHFVVNAQDGSGQVSGWRWSYGVLVDGAPGVPTGLSLSKTLVVPGEGVNLAWNGVSDPGGNLDSYIIHAQSRANGSAAWSDWWYVATVYSTTCGGLVAGNGYDNRMKFRVIAHDSAGNYSSSWSAESAEIVVNSPPTNTTGVSPSAEATLFGALTVSWNAVTDINGNLSYYEIQYAVANASKVWGVWNAWTSGSMLSFNTNVLNWAEGPLCYYKWRIRAVDTLGYASAWVETAAIRRGQPVTAPGAISPSGGLVNLSVALTWAASGGGDGSTKYYDVKVAVNGGAETTVGTVTTPSYTLNTSAYADNASIVVRVTCRDSQTNATGASVTFTKSAKPTTPTIVNKNNGTCYTKRPVFMINIPVDPNNLVQTLIAKIDGSTANIAISTNGVLSGKTTVKPTADLTVGAHILTFYTNNTTKDSDTVTLNFTIGSAPSVLIAGVSKIDDTDVTSWRTMVDNISNFYTGASPSWNPATVARGNKVKDVYGPLIANFRTIIQSIVSAINGYDSATSANDVSSPSWASIANGKATNMNEIRAYILNNL